MSIISFTEKGNKAKGQVPGHHEDRHLVMKTETHQITVSANHSNREHENQTNKNGTHRFTIPISKR